MSEDFKGISVTPRKFEDAEKLIKRFMREVRNSRIADEWLERCRYEKPSVKRRKKQAKARWRLAKEQE